MKLQVQYPKTDGGVGTWGEQTIRSPGSSSPANFLCKETSWRPVILFTTSILASDLGHLTCAVMGD